MVFIALLPLLGGILVGWSGYLGWRGRISRDKGVGVRTWATLRSAEGFRVGNTIAGLPTMAAGGVGIATGLAALVMPNVATVVLVTTFGLLGMTVLIGAGGVLGHRAAAAVPVREPTTAAHGGCGGCSCGVFNCSRV